MSNEFTKEFVIKNKENTNEIVENLKILLNKSKFSVLSEYNLSDVIKSNYSNFEEEIVVIEFCNSTLSKMIIEENVNNCYILPCKISIFKRNKDIILVLSKSSSIFDHDNHLIKVIEKVERQLFKLLETFSQK